MLSTSINNIGPRQSEGRSGDGLVWAQKGGIMNKEKLIQAIDASGFKREHIAKQIGLSSYGLAKKINGITEFKVSEAATLTQLLNLSREQAVDIFLS